MNLVEILRVLECKNKAINGKIYCKYHYCPGCFGVGSMEFKHQYCQKCMNRIKFYLLIIDVRFSCSLMINYIKQSYNQVKDIEIMDK
jgi:hypothetical protein